MAGKEKGKIPKREPRELQSREPIETVQIGAGVIVSGPARKPGTAAPPFTIARTPNGKTVFRQGIKDVQSFADFHRTAKTYVVGAKCIRGADKGRRIQQAETAVNATRDEEIVGYAHVLRAKYPKDSIRKIAERLIATRIGPDKRNLTGTLSSSQVRKIITTGLRGGR